MSESLLDLSELALDRAPAPSATRRRHRRRWVSRYVVPVGLLLGFVVLLGAAAGRQLLPKQSVTVVPVIVKRGEVQRAGMPRFQSPGWIEPRPTAVSVAALAPGVIEELLVVDGQHVKKGEPIARLIAIDAELAVEQAKATLAIREGELQRAEAARTAAITRLDKPVHLKAPLADAQSLLAKASTELEKLPFLIKAAEANVEFTRRSLEGKQAAKSSVAGVIIERALKDHAAALAELEELQQREPNLRREMDALQQKVDALSEQLELLVEERQQADQATANVASATAIRDEAKLRLRLAELNLERTIVRAPIDGRILRVTAAPGMRVMGLEEVAGQSSSTVAEMYDPRRLQVRADVRLEDVPMVTPGAPVEIQTASSGKAIQGRVLQLTSTANIQKNTLEVKVELIDPPETVSPEMLVTATFLAPESQDTPGEVTDVDRILVPKQLVQTDHRGTAVWIVDAHERAIRQTVSLGSESDAELTEIVEGLNATDKLITSDISALDSGDAVMVGGEDRSIGVGR